MKADDPRLEKARRDAIERVTRINAMILTVLKNHLVVEQFMDEFLVASGQEVEGTFAQKVQASQCLKPPEIDEPIWNVLTAANQLRNKIAHTLEQEEINKKATEVRAAYLAALSEKQRTHSKNVSDVDIAASAFQLCAAYFVAATDTARSAKNVRG